MPLVPDVRSQRPAQAFTILAEAGFQPVILGLPTSKSDGNLGFWVAAQEPEAAVEASPGTRVALALRRVALSLGGSIEGPPVAKPVTPAPDVVGLELERAMAEVTRRGLIAVVIQPLVPVESLAVFEQRPNAGAAVEAFREVVLWLDDQ
jgi:hypothetical protein